MKYAGYPLALAISGQIPLTPAAVMEAFAYASIIVALGVTIRGYFRWRGLLLMAFPASWFVFVYLAMRTDLAEVRASSQGPPEVVMALSFLGTVSIWVGVSLRRHRSRHPLPGPLCAIGAMAYAISLMVPMLPDGMGLVGIGVVFKLMRITPLGGCMLLLGVGLTFLAAIICSVARTGVGGYTSQTLADRAFVVLAVAVAGQMGGAQLIMVLGGPLGNASLTVLAKVSLLALGISTMFTAGVVDLILGPPPPGSVEPATGEEVTLNPE